GEPGSEGIPTAADCRRPNCPPALCRRQGRRSIPVPEAKPAQPAAPGRLLGGLADAAEVLGQLLRRRVAAGGVLAQATHADRLQGGRDVGPCLAEGCLTKQAEVGDL